MKLKKWRKSADITLTQLAADVGVSDITIGRYERGERIPRPKIMARIVRLTDGAVRPDDFYDIEGWKS